MELQKITYLFLLIGLIILPVIIGIKTHFQLFSKIRYLIPAIIFTGAIFIIWDKRFEELEIWNFNYDFLLGLKIQNLPLEEWLFFFAVPLFSVSVYEWLKTRIRRLENLNAFVVISLVLLIIFGALAYFSRQKLYTFFTFFLLTIYFGYTIFRNKFKKNYTAFYGSVLIALVPFLIVRGVLTSLPVITFNAEHILNIHILSIPVEDLGYFFLLHLMNVTIYEYLKERQFY